MKKIYLAITIILSIILTGCSSAPKITSVEKTQMRTRTFEANYENTYRATMTVLENQGYTIDNTDMNSGLIRANISKERFSTGQKLASAFFLGVSRSGVQVYDLSSTISKISDQNTKVRININLNSDVKVGYNDSKSSKEINDPEIYNALLNEIRVEIERRKAING